MKISRFYIGAVSLLAATLLSIATTAAAGDVYEWTDEEGNIHFADSPNDIPPKFQDQFKTRKFKESKSQDKSKSAIDNPNPKNSSPDVQGQEQKPRRYEIPYRAREGKAKVIIIPVKFNDSVTAAMALDTGSTGMLISNWLAEKLGVLSEDKGKLKLKVKGVGTAPAILTIIDQIEIGGAKDHFIPTAVADLQSKSSEQGLIGMDFMSNYSISIDTKKNVVILEEKPFDPDSPGGHDEEWWRTNFQEFGSSRTAWKRYLENLDNEINAFSIDITKGDDIKKLRSNAEEQYKEADKLFDKLNQYAAQYSVPMHWRREE